MLNKVQIIGRLGRDPEMRYTQSGMPIANMRIATDESYTDRDGNRVDRTEWHTVVAFQRQAETCSNYLAKGSLVYVEGSLQTRKWQDQQGQDRYSTEIKAQRVVFLDRKGARDSGETQYHGNDGYARTQGGQGGNQRSSSQAGPAPTQTQQWPNDDPDMGPAFPSEASGMDDVPF